MSSKPEFLTVQEECPSGTCSPVLAWSPLPQRRKLNFVKSSSSSIKHYDENSEPLYPNCDFTVWLRSCQEEIKTPMCGKISGNIPKWLNGSLIRNGPGSIKVGDEEFTHLFDSSGLLHKFGIKNGKVTYQCRFLQSDVYKKNWGAKRIVYSEFGTKIVEDPCHSIFKRIATVFSKESSDNSMISIYPLGDELYAFGETPMIHRIDSETLETKEKVNIGEYVSIVNHTSHPHVLKSGTVYNLGMSVSSTGIYYNIVEFPKTEDGLSKSMFENARIVASVPARWRLHPSYMHSFGITDSYYIIIEQPLSISVTGFITSKLKNEPLAGCFRWYHEEYTRITVISRTNGEVFKIFVAKSFFYLHVINQYELDDHIVLDICMYKDPSMLDCMYIETMKVCDANLQIRHINARFPGSVHDEAIWLVSNVREFLLNSYRNNRDKNTWLLGDSGYTIQPFLLTPIVGAEPDTPNGRYTASHVQVRNTIERCIGVLKSYFRCLKADSVLHYAPVTASKIIYASAVLHNICRKRNIVDEDLENEFDAVVPDIDDEDDRDPMELVNEGVAIRNNLIQEVFNV